MRNSGFFHELQKVNLAFGESAEQKEIEKVVHNWEEEGIKVEKGRWGKFYLIKSKKKILLDKNLDVQTMSLDQAKEIYKANSSKKSKK